MGKRKLRRAKTKERPIKRRSGGGKRSIIVRWDRAKRRRVIVKRYPNTIEAVREANVMRSYKPNPYLVRFYRYYVRNGRGHIVMKRVSGPTLSALIKRRGPLKPSKAIDIATNILKGLHILHSRGFIHGDLHGENVIVSNFKTPSTTIIDFQHTVKMNARGRAKARRKLARPPMKLAPESRQRIITRRYDLYGVGYMCASMLLGKEPKRRLGVKPRGKRKLLWGVILKAMHPKPSKRYRTAREMIAALQKVRGILYPVRRPAEKPTPEATAELPEPVTV